MSKWMKHPKLPEDQLIHVPDDAVEGNRRAGWEVTEAPPEPTAADFETAAADTAERATPPESESDLEPDPHVAAVTRPDESTPAQDGKE